ncbi:MAG: hypothetical protein WC648_04410 [Candidatus Paceibacterota bacterium]|jgi:hypothetical protein
MLTLRADNRSLVNGAKFAYLIDNNQTNVSSLEISNIDPFAVGTPILLSEIGQSNASILKVRSISGNVIYLGDNNNIAVTTSFAYPESTKVTALQFDQIRFFWTPFTNTIADENPTFDDNTPLTDWTDLDPSSYYSVFADTSHSTGFGWFQYRNTLSEETSLESNPIPYLGFNLNTVQQVFSDFDSGLNTNELRLVSVKEKFSWLNEALSILKLKLNLTNVEYTVSTPQTITTVANNAEYILPDDFSDMVEITNEDGLPIDFLSVSGVMSNNGTNPSVTQHYLRGRYIGFSPTPTESGTIYKYTYRAKASRVTNLSTYIDLPDNAFYSLKDYMLYRACLKFTNPLAATYMQAFKNAVDLYTQSSVKRSADLDVWGIDPTCNT